MCAGGTLPAPEKYENLRETKIIDTLCCGGDGIAAYKTFAIVRSDNPQTNPTITGFTVNDAPLAPAHEGGLGRVVCKNRDGCGADVDVALTLDKSSFQTFETIEFEERITVEETLYVSWFVDGGEFESSRAGVGSHIEPFENVWQPEMPGVFNLYIVAHDTRGGASWETYQVEVVGP